MEAELQQADLEIGQDKRTDDKPFRDWQNSTRSALQIEQLRLVFLHSWIDQERTRALNLLPITLLAAEKETRELLAKITSLRVRIDMLGSSRGEAHSQLVAKRRWFSARLKILKEWVESETKSEPKQQPISICEAETELEDLGEKIRSLTQETTLISFNENSLELDLLHRTIRKKESRVAFLRKWVGKRKHEEKLEITKQNEVAKLQAQEEATQVKDSLKQDRKILKKEHAKNNKLSSGMPLPTSLDEAIHERDVLRVEVRDMEEKLSKMPKADTSLRRKDLARGKTLRTARLSILNAWIKDYNTRTLQRSFTNQQDIQRKPLSIKDAEQERSRLKLMSGNENGSQKDEKLTEPLLITQRLKFLNKWIVSNNPFEEFDLMAPEGLDRALDKLIGLLNREVGYFINNEPHWLVVWNNLRERIGGLRPMKLKTLPDSSVVQQ
jgi:hypothetical protein